MLTWPDAIIPSGVKFTLNSNGIEFSSPFNGASQTVTFPGSAWSASLTFNDLDDWESRQLESLIVRLDGIGGRILLRDYGRWGRPAMGSPVVVGDNNTGNLLTTRGWTPSRKVLHTGDYISVSNELKMVLADVWSGLDGSATIEIGPMWRVTPQAGTPVVTDKTYGVFRPKKNDNGWERQPAMNNGFSLEFIEAI